MKNRRISTKNTINPRTTKTPKMIPFSHGFGRGIKGKRTTKSSCIYPQQIVEGKASKSLHEKHQEKAPKITKKEKSGRTQTNLKESRRIIYTYHEGSYKV
jgi:hypothetical protein